MISTKDYLLRWNTPDLLEFRDFEGLLIYSSGCVEKLTIPKIMRDFLINCGLPKRVYTYNFDLPPNCF